MFHKKVMLVFILVLGLSLLSISAFAQGEGLGERVMIYPWEIWDGEITVSTDDTVVLGARWGACTKGLAQAWTRTSYINYSINEEPLFSSQKESRKFWGRPYPVINTEPDNCVNGSETIWVVAWEYELGLLKEGDYQVHFEMGTTHPFHDGFDSDGDGKPDPQVFDIQFDFKIKVIDAGAISGTVTEDNGDPLEGLDVVACQFDDPEICFSAVTTADGSYSMYPVAEGDYRVFVYQQDNWIEEFYNNQPRWDWADPVPVVKGQDTPDINFTLELGGSISGFVTTESGDPIEFLWVDACEYDVMDDPFCGSAETNEDGEYTIGGLREGDYIVNIWNQGWVSQFYDVEIPYGEPDRVSVIVGEDHGGIDFTLEMGGSISGTVYEEGGGPIGDLDVVAVNFETDEWMGGAPSEPDGSYLIQGLPAGTYRVFVYQQDFWLEEFYNDNPIWDWADPVTVLVGQDTPEIDFDLVMGGSISGFVTDEFTGEGIGGLDVIACVFYAEDLCFWGAMTEPDGSYSIRGIPADTYRVFVYQQNYWMEEFYDNQLFLDEADPIIVFPGDDTGGISFALSKMTTISGRVTNAHDEEGIPGVWVDSCHESVLIEDWGQSPLCNGDDTDKNGFYSISILQEGNYRLVIWDPRWFAEFYNNVPDYGSATLVPAVGGQETAGIDFILTQAGTVSGMVFESNGTTPVANIGVDVVEGGHGACTDENGYYMIGSLPFGTYDIVAGRDFCGEGGFAETIVVDISVSLAAPHVQNLDFNLDQAASISGRVIDTFGYEIVGIWVEVNDFSTYSWAGGAHTDTDGYYSVSGLTPGDYRICIWDQSWVHQCYNMALPGAETLVALVSGEHRDDIDFTLTQAGAISGYVVDEDGEPIIGIGVGACQYDEGDPPVCYGNSTDNQGNYTLSGMIPDEYLVFIWDQEGWVNQLFDHTQDFDLATPVLVEAGQDTGGIFFTLTPAVP